MPLLTPVPRLGGALPLAPAFIPPAPLVPLAPVAEPLVAAASAAAGAVLGWLASQLWGLLTGRSEPQRASLNGLQLTFPQPTSVSMSYEFRWGSYTITNCDGSNPRPAPGGTSGGWGLSSSSAVSLNTRNGAGGTRVLRCVGSPATGTVVRPSLVNSSGVTVTGGGGRRDGGDINNGVQGSEAWSLVMTSLLIGGSPYVPPVIGPGLFVPQDPPDADPAERPLAPPLLPESPPAVPQAPPDREPLAPPIGDPAPGGDAPARPTPPPAPGSTPSTVPLRPPQPGTGPGGTPLPQEISPGGSPVPRPPAPVSVTPIGQEVTPDGPVGGPGQAPAPTLEGIASELGRVERKLLQLLDRPKPGDDVTGILDLLDDIWQLLQSAYGAGHYELVGVCQPTGQGEAQPVRRAEWSGGFGQLGLVEKKLDALAMLLQHHKDLRQPVCHTKPSGQPVTIQFQEVT